MRFARYIAAALLMLALLTPIRGFVRLVAGASSAGLLGATVDQSLNDRLAPLPNARTIPAPSAEDLRDSINRSEAPPAVPPVAAAWEANAKYGFILFASWAILLPLLWGIRRVLQLTDKWETSGLRILDFGLTSTWPRLISLVACVLVVVGALLGGAGPRVPALLEAAVVCVAVLAAVPWFTAPQPASGDEEYDPLPEPQSPIPEPPAPGPEPAPAPDADAKPLSLWWYFEREPGHPGGGVQRYDVRVIASQARYSQLVARDHGVTSLDDFARFARDGITPEVEQAVSGLRDISKRDKLGSVREINNVLAFAQQFEYELDSVRHASEYPKYPLETMLDGCGDCEDHAIVAAACLHRMGYEIRLVGLDYGDSSGHIALAVRAPEDVPDAHVLKDHTDGKRYYFCEPTTDASSRHEGAQVFRIGDCDERLDDATKYKLVRVW